MISRQKLTIQRNVSGKKPNHSNAHCQTRAQKNGGGGGQKNLVNSFATLFIVLFLKDPTPIFNIWDFGEGFKLKLLC